MPDEREGAPPSRETVAERRRDVVNGNSVLLTPARSGRPHTVDSDCPFCRGNEHRTASEIERVAPGDDPSSWRVRVVRNRYPVVGGTDGARGESEVVVFASHTNRLEDLGTGDVSEILRAIRRRVACHRAAGWPSIQVFVNAEAPAGASIVHPHAQVIALDFVPPAVTGELAMAAELRADPLAVDLALAREHDLVLVDGELAAWCPWGAPGPFAVRIAPRVATARFDDLDDSGLDDLALVLLDVLRAVNTVLERPPYNVVVFCDHEEDGLTRRWRVEVVPRVTVAGGFEIGTAVPTHATPPDAAAASLRAGLETLLTKAGS